LAKQVFLDAIPSLSRVWWVGANVDREVLNVPGLLDATDNAAA
jgi:hypothetical protein